MDNAKLYIDSLIDAKMYEINCYNALNDIDGVEMIKKSAGDYEIQIYSGIKLLAAAVGAETETKPRDCEKYPYEITFQYCGFVFLELVAADENE